MITLRRVTWFVDGLAEVGQQPPDALAGAPVALDLAVPAVRGGIEGERLLDLAPGPQPRRVLRRTATPAGRSRAARSLRISVSIDSRLTFPGIDMINARTDSGILYRSRSDPFLTGMTA